MVNLPTKGLRLFPGHTLRSDGTTMTCSCGEADCIARQTMAGACQILTDAGFLMARLICNACGHEAQGMWDSINPPEAYTCAKCGRTDRIDTRGENQPPSP